MKNINNKGSASGKKSILRLILSFFNNFCGVGFLFAYKLLFLGFIN